MKKLLAVGIFFLALAPSTSRASQLFNLFAGIGNFGFSATYTITDSVMSSFFMAVNCSANIPCIFDQIVSTAADPFDGIPSDTIVLGRSLSGIETDGPLHLFEEPSPFGLQHLFRIHTRFGNDRSGLYTAQAVIPEASAWLLVGIGLMFLAAMSRKILASSLN